MEKWKKAVVHLECATNSEDFSGELEIFQKKLLAGEIIIEEYQEIIKHFLFSKKIRDLRWNGTAIFITHNRRRYLLTARHVVWDKISADRKLLRERQNTEVSFENLETNLSRFIEENYQYEIFNMIFRVPSYDEITQDNSGGSRAFLMNMGSAMPRRYAFSTPELDMAVISLNQKISGIKFGEDLIRRGYEPISSEEIIGEPSSEGAEVYTVGFPSAMAIQGRLNQSEAEDNWSSYSFSLPTFAFGRVSMLHKNLPFFWTDMSIYPGNSGGPVIENGKLVGIVSGQPCIPVENSDATESLTNYSTRIPFGKIIKTKYALDLLSNQEKVDDYWDRYIDIKPSITDNTFAKLGG